MTLSRGALAQGTNFVVVAFSRRIILPDFSWRLESHHYDFARLWGLGVSPGFDRCLVVPTGLTPGG